MFTSQDADTQSAAAAARGIKDSFTRFVELISTDDARASSVAAFTIFLMDSVEDAEKSMRFTLLDSISRRVVAVQRPGQSWDAVIDGESVRLNDDCRSFGCNTLIAPVLEFAPAAAAAAAAAASGGLDDFDDAKCSICLCTLFESRSDGSVDISARELKCLGRHTFHSQCARGWFVTGKHTNCPCCRHEFSGLFCSDIAATLQHEVEPDGTGFSVHWNNPPDQRLAALSVLMPLPPETPLGRTIASALLWSCFDDAAGIANAVLRCGRLYVAILDLPQEMIGTWQGKAD